VLESTPAEVENMVFIFLIIFQFIIFFKVFAHLDGDRFHRFRYLGPIAFVIPGVLKPRGLFYFSTFIIVGCALTFIAFHMFGSPEIY
jgi:hypothetical protein